MTSAGKYIKEEAYCTVLVEMQIRLALWKNLWKFLKKLKIVLVFEPSIPLWAFIYTKEINSVYQRYICAPMCIAQERRTSKEFITLWLNNENVAHVYNGVLLSHKKNEVWSPVICCRSWE
jgi:hypothetical protein